ncbi:P-loop containing nucleoside triphosphate hydrolase protein [Mycena epipterygia]|nr:P-loop containing nucleoside triphosphate hydrolase protein [Mycena epipterygia]
MKELCEDTVDIITVLRDQISAHGDTAALKFKTQCEELDVFLQDVLEAVNQLRMKPRGLGARFKEVIKANSTMDDISKFRTRMRELRSNFMLMVTMDTNFQVQKVLTVISPMPVVQVPQQINNCPPPSRIFHGRQTILQQMHQYFAQTTRKQNIFLLHGLGGAGKTQIALKFILPDLKVWECIYFILSFTDIFFIDSSSVETIDTGLKNIANTKTVGESSQDALQWLRSKQDDWLLFFDNADDPKLNLNNYVPQCDHGNILITSRNPGLCVYAGSHFPVSDMEEIEAADLLLKSASWCLQVLYIVQHFFQALHYLPLAIIQAGAFISKSGDLDSYLELYEQNRARLLSQKPAQTHDNYGWTVYTTWQISFDQLSQPAATFLQLCSLLHHQGISEQIFKNATNKFGPSSLSKEELQMPLEFLSQFLGPDGVWDSFCFIDMTNEVRAYSLINFHPQKKMFSIHPLVHDWTRSTLTDKESYHHCMVAIVGMSLAGLLQQDFQLASPWMLPHIDFLLQEDSNIIPDFRHEYGKLYVWGEKFQKAEVLQEAVVQKRRDLLGEDHLDTLEAMYWLAWIYRLLGKLKEAEELEVVVLKQRKDILGDNHPDTLHAMENLAATYWSLGKFKEAEKLEVLVLEKRRHVLGNNHPSTFTAMRNLAVIYTELGKLKEAEELEVVVLEKQRNGLGDNHPETLMTMGNLATTYQALGRLQEAEGLKVVVLEK